MMRRTMKKLVSLLLVTILLAFASLPTFASDTADLSLAATYGDSLGDVDLPDGCSWKDAAETSVGTVGSNMFAYEKTTESGAEEHLAEIQVQPAFIGAVEVITDGGQYYTGNPVEPEVKASFKDVTLINNVDYTVTYEDNTNVGVAKVNIHGIGNFKGKTSVSFFIIKTDVEGISLNEREIELMPEKKFQLTAEIAPSNASIKAVSWTSTDESVAMVDQNGLVTAISDGKTVIRAITKDGNLEADCIVDVLTHVGKVQITTGTVKMRYKDTYSLKTIISPWNATNKEMKWSSSNESVVKVDANGKLTSVGKGFATITVTTEDGGYTDSCEVEVYYAWWQYIIWVFLGCIWYFR